MAAKLFQERLAALFERLPMLSGFHVSHELRVVEIATQVSPEWVGPQKMVEEIRAALEELVIGDPEGTAELLRGRTFARAFH
jgi:hypothetical protein